jgi:alcohol dehydrogenase class IV
MTPFSFNTARFIRQEFGAAKHFGDIFHDYITPDVAAGPVMFITDPGVLKLGLADAAMASLKDAGVELVLFSDVVADPPEAVVLNAAEKAKTAGIKVVIGFGGGSSMDVAKLIAFLASSDQSLDEIYGVGMAKGTRLPLILVPTTAGTGSEVTAVSIVTTGESEKKGVVSPIILPDLALLDAELTLGLPPHITAATGIDAMVHAIEAYTSTNANNNPISAMLARQALSLMGGSIETAVFEGGNAEARTNMLLGAMFAGQAFANSPVAAVHALAYPVGGIFHVPHGLSNSLVLPHVMRFNASACALQYAELAPYVFADIDTARSAQTVSAEFIERLAALTEKLGLQTRLSQMGIADTDLDRLTDDAMKQTRLLVNNPREVTYQDAHDIYRAAL